MTASTPMDALRLLAGLIAADVRNGGPLLAVALPAVEPRARGRGRPKSVPYAVAAISPSIAA